MFQGNINSFQVPFPYKGINNNADNDITSARYIQNMLVGDNRMGQVRFGTSLVSEFAFDDDRIFGDPIETMSFLKVDGTSEKIIYLQYLTELQYLSITDHVAIAPCIGKDGCSTITLDISTYPADQKAYFSKVLFDEVYLYVRQNISDGATIDTFNLSNDGNTITFNMPFAPDFFEQDLGVNTFELFVERGGIYRVKPDNSYELIGDDFDPNVIISHINFQGKLIIANGVDPVKIYDGTNLTDLKGDASIPIDGQIALNNLEIQFNINETVLPEVQGNIIVGSVLTLISDAETKIVNVTAIAFAPPANNLIRVTITVDIAPQVDTRKILYKKPCPAFSFIGIAHKRLWALPEGRSYQNKFRSPELAMRVYYAAKLDSIEDWFSEKTNQIDFINTSSTAGIPDNLEAIVAFEGKTLFIGRETIQVWTGEDPTTLDDGRELTLPDFKWEKTLPTGILQKTLFLEVPNAFLFLSKFGVISLTTANIYQQIEIGDIFSTPIDHHLNNQLAFIETNRDYRTMKAFLYPYGRFFGIRIKYSCFIYQFGSQKAWVIFNENFAEAKSFFYDSISQNLYLGLPNGKLVVYADKINSQSYEEYGKGKLSWAISYNWIYIGDTWSNTKVYIASKTLKALTVKTRFFTNQDESRSIIDDIELKQKAALYDITLFGTKPYSYNDTPFSHESVRFTCDSLMIELSGLSNDLFVFNKLFLVGGNKRTSRRNR